MTVEDRDWLAHQYRCFARNMRWGTCGDCPRSGREAYPEFCVYTTRYDHLLTAEQLAQQTEIRSRT